MIAPVLAAAAALVPAAADAQQLSLRPFASGLPPLTAIASTRAEPRRLYAVEQEGRIRYFVNGRLRGTFLDIRSRIASGGEQGLLGLAFHPNYARNHRFYVDYTDTSGNTRVVEFRSRNGIGRPSTARQLLFVRQPYANHNGGQLQFDRDGTPVRRHGRRRLRRRSWEPRAEPERAAREAAAHQSARAWSALANRGARVAKSVAVHVRSRERRPLHRRRRPGCVGGDRLQVARADRNACELRLEGVRGPRTLLEHAARPRPAGRADRGLQPQRWLLSHRRLRLSRSHCHRCRRPLFLRRLLQRQHLEPACRQRPRDGGAPRKLPRWAADLVR